VQKKAQFVFRRNIWSRKMTEAALSFLAASVI
jgi:hypothetical protein